MKHRQRMRTAASQLPETFYAESAVDTPKRSGGVRRRMKNIGIIGGVGWPSTGQYYELIHKEANARLGGFCAPDVLVYSMNFDPIEKLHAAGAWEESAPYVIHAAESLARAGADFVAIASATTSIPSRMISDAISIPLLTVVDPIAQEAKKQGHSRLGLLGTKPTMEYPYFAPELEKHGFDVIVPNADDREFIHHVIYHELCQGQMLPQSKKRFLQIIDDLVDRGAEAVVLGCTEIPLLIQEKDVYVALLDIAKLHSKAIVEEALKY